MLGEQSRAEDIVGSAAPLDGIMAERCTQSGLELEIQFDHLRELHFVVDAQDPRLSPPVFRAPFIVRSVSCICLNPLLGVLANG